MARVRIFEINGSMEMSDWVKLEQPSDGVVYLRQSTIESVIPRPDGGGIDIVTISGEEYVTTSSLIYTDGLIKLTLFHGPVVYLRQSTIESVIPLASGKGSIIETISGNQHVVRNNFASLNVEVFKTSDWITFTDKLEGFSIRVRLSLIESVTPLLEGNKVIMRSGNEHIVEECGDDGRLYLKSYRLKSEEA